MKKLVATILILAFAAGGYFYFSKNVPTSQETIPSLREKARSSSSQTVPVEIRSRSIFVPYWQLGDELELEGYDRVIYFGVSADTSGIQKEERGYRQLETFVAKIPTDKERALTVRMTNTDINQAVLARKTSQELIIEEAINTAVENKFSGIILDFEIFSLFNTNVPNQINEFVQTFYKRAKEANLTFGITIYGDVFYRKRPFDVSFLAKHSDEILIMAYDFHKSRGEPGPNFPLQGREKYGYDLTVMINDFLRVTPAEKLSVLFGMYGYDWAVDEKKRPIRPASARTLQEVKNKYIDECGTTNCVPFRDMLSHESEINFVDETNQYHVIWFEDERSVSDKIEFLRRKGIGKIGYWAYGYF